MKLLNLMIVLMFFSGSLSHAGHHEGEGSYMMQALQNTGQHNILISAIKTSGLEKLFNQESKVQELYMHRMMMHLKNFQKL